MLNHHYLTQSDGREGGWVIGLAPCRKLGGIIFTIVSGGVADGIVKGEAYSFNTISKTARATVCVCVCM